jgi:uncharacterized protein YbbC (DUF1343 family)
MSQRFPRFAIAVAILLISAGFAAAAVQNGVDVLEADRFKALDGAHVALITNHTGVNRKGERTVDVLRRAPNVTLVCLLSPEHGFAGTARDGEKISSSTDARTGLPVFSLYGDTSRPTDEMLNGVDTIVFDIQDIGVRFYTYNATMAMALEEAARRNLRFVVLDRPNPIRGDVIEGDVLAPDKNRITGYFALPVRHGLTSGEIAAWTNATEKLNANLEVVKLRGWRRKLWFDQTGQPFVPPSPNIRDVGAELLYVGVGPFEATNMSVGRGTQAPFHVFGAPWIDGKKLSAHLASLRLRGLRVAPAEFVPQRDMYRGELCEGVKVTVTNRNAARPFRLFVAAFEYLMRTYPDDFKPNWEEVRLVTGSNALKDGVAAGVPYADLVAAYRVSEEAFEKQIAPFRLYP